MNNESNMEDNESIDLMKQYDNPLNNSTGAINTNNCNSSSDDIIANNTNGTIADENGLVIDGTTNPMQLSKRPQQNVGGGGGREINDPLNGSTSGANEDAFNSKINKSFSEEPPNTYDELIVYIKSQISKHLVELNKSREEYEKTTKLLIEKVQGKYPDYSKHKIIKYFKTTLNEFSIRYNTSIDNLIKQDKFKIKAKFDLVGNYEATNNENNSNANASTTVPLAASQQEKNSQSAKTFSTSTNGKSGLNEAKCDSSSSSPSPKFNNIISSSSASPPPSSKHSDKNTKKLKSSHNQQSTSPSLSTKTESKVCLSL